MRGNTVSYLDDYTTYTDSDFRNRAAMCIREQALIFAGDGRPDIRALGMGVVAGDWSDIDAVMAAVAAAPGSSELDTDTGLLGAVQAVWPAVAAARHPS